MGLLDGIRSYVRPEEQSQHERTGDPERHHRREQSSDPQAKIEEMSPKEVAAFFAQKEQNKRLNIVSNGGISEDKWQDMTTFIKNDPKQQSFWGLDGSQTEMEDGTSVCICHGEEVRSWTEYGGNQDTTAHTEGVSTASKTEHGGKLGGGGGFGLPGVGTVDATGEVETKRGRSHEHTEQETAQTTETRGAEKTFYECGIESTDSPLSRQGFIKAGDFLIGRSNEITEFKTPHTDDYDLDVEQAAEQETPEKSLDTLQDERDELDDQFEEVDEEISVVNNLLEENKKLFEQNMRAISSADGSLEKRKYLSDERDRLLDERDRLTENRTTLRSKQADLRTNRDDLQERIEEHDEYETAAESEEESVDRGNAEETAEENAESVSAEAGEETVSSDGTAEKDATTENRKVSTASTAPMGEGGEPTDSNEATEKQEEPLNKGEYYLDKYGPKKGGTSNTEKRSTERTADAAEQTIDPADYDNKGKYYLDKYAPEETQTKGTEERANKDTGKSM